MPWATIMVYGIIAGAVFSIVVGALWALMPNAMSGMMPADIRHAAPRRAPEEVVALYSSLLLLYGSLLAFIIIGARSADITGFWSLFWTGYIVAFIVNMADFWLLDIWFRATFKKRILIKGTEHCKSWETTNWLKSMAIREHFLWWPLVVCPLVGALVAAVSSLTF